MTSFKSGSSACPISISILILEIKIEISSLPKKSISIPWFEIEIGSPAALFRYAIGHFYSVFLKHRIP